MGRRGLGRVLARVRERTHRVRLRLIRRRVTYASTLLELVGFAALFIGGFLLAVWLGWMLVGLTFLLMGYLLSLKE